MILFVFGTESSRKICLDRETKQQKVFKLSVGILEICDTKKLRKWPEDDVNFMSNTNDNFRPHSTELLEKFTTLLSARNPKLVGNWSSYTRQVFLSSFSRLYNWLSSGWIFVIIDTRCLKVDKTASVKAFKETELEKQSQRGQLFFDMHANFDCGRKSETQAHGNSSSNSKLIYQIHNSERL